MPTFSAGKDAKSRDGPKKEARFGWLKNNFAAGLSRSNSNTPMNFQKIFLLFLLFLSENALLGQSEKVVVDRIHLEGNRRTRPGYIFRELDFRVGDSLELVTLAERLERNELLVRNNGPFSEVKIKVKKWPDSTNHIEFLVKVSESWRIWPIPIFELADRNFNVWWRDHDHSLRYLNYGLWTYILNFTGRRDELRVKANWGYSNFYELEYSLPGLGKRKILGLKFQGISHRQREITVASQENRQVLFFNPAAFIFHRRLVSMTVSARPKLFWSYRTELLFQKNTVADTVAMNLNPDFFGKKRTSQQFPGLVFAARIDRRDDFRYPVRGHFLEIEARKMGLPGGDLNTFSLLAEVAKWHSFSKNWSLELDVKARRSMLRAAPIPFYNYPGLGFGRDYLRGYEYYIVNGADYVFFKSSLRLEVFKRKFDFKKMVPIDMLQRWPVRAYLTFNGDLGFVNDPFYFSANPLTNSVLWGFGPGVDIVVRNTIVGQIECSANREGDVGIYFHLKKAF